MMATNGAGGGVAPSMGTAVGCGDGSVGSKENWVDQDGGLEMVRVFLLLFTGERSGVIRRTRSSCPVDTALLPASGQRSHALLDEEPSCDQEDRAPLRLFGPDCAEREPFR